MVSLANVCTIRQAHWDEMRSDVENRLPDEACGLVAGRERCSISIYPINNILHSPTRFRLDPQGQLDAMLSMEEQGLDMMAIYHSHPVGPSYPSITDIEEAAYPDTLHLIWHPHQSNWYCRGYLIHSGVYEEVKLKILRDE
jgi:proteasome lid subunit RPN8/RPN11